MFGGWLCAVSDPFHALLCGRLIPGLDVWSKANAVEFKRPAREQDVDFQVTITDEDLREIHDQLARAGKATHTFQATIEIKPTRSSRQEHGLLAQTPAR